MTQTSSFFRWLWPVLLVFLPKWMENVVFMKEGATPLWNPLTIALSWWPSFLSLTDYSMSYAAGLVLMLAICLYWWLRYAGMLYAILLFFAAAMTGPTWTTLIRYWHYYAGVA